MLDGVDGPNPTGVLRVVEFAEIQDVSLNDSSAPDATILHDAPIAMSLAVLLSSFASEKHDEHSFPIAPRPVKNLGRRYSTFSINRY